MDIDTGTRSAFVDILHLQIGQLRHLLDLLQQEYQQLSTPTSEALVKLQTEKKAQLEAIEKSADKHRQLLLQLGVTSDRQGTEALIGEDAELKASWKEYLSLLESCQKQNEINGGAVELNQRQVNQALNILMGLGESQKTYGPSGESRPAHPSKSLGKA